MQEIVIVKDSARNPWFGSRLPNSLLDVFPNSEGQEAGHAAHRELD